jgi:hypothetical protein
VILHVGDDTTVFSRQDEVASLGQLVGEQNFHHLIGGQAQCVYHLCGQEVSVLANHILSIV